MIKFIFYAVLAYAVGLLLSPAFATGKNSTTNYYDTDNNYYSETNTLNSGVSDSDLSEAVAKASACGANFYYGTHKKQGAIHGVYYDGESEICLEGAWRPKDSAVMWDIGIVPDEDSDYILWRGGVQFEF